jgi:hypothetical protein
MVVLSWREFCCAKAGKHFVMSIPRIPGNPSPLSSQRHVCLCLVAIFLVACSGGSMRPAASPAPGLVEVSSATVIGLFDDPVTLRDGRWEGEPYVAGGASRPTAGVIEGLSATGDLDDDGAVETVAFLWSATGGSGTRNFIAVFSSGEDGANNQATMLIGDRVKLREARITDRRIEVDVVEHGPDDAMCCPSVEATRAWIYDGQNLREAPRQ